MIFLTNTMTVHEIAQFLMKTNKTLRFLSFIKLYSIAHVYLVFMSKRLHKRYLKNIVKDLNKMNKDYVHNLTNKTAPDLNSQIASAFRTENEYYCDNCGNIDYLCKLPHEGIEKPHCQNCHSTENLYEKNN